MERDEVISISFLAVDKALERMGLEEEEILEINANVRTFARQIWELRNKQRRQQIQEELNKAKRK